MEKKNKEVLAMYDVRGIQNYIFRTNYIKEVVGASAIVENIIIDGLNAGRKELEWQKSLCLTDWESDGNTGEEFFANPEILMQVMFIGGGNAYVLYRTEDLCHEMNKKLAKYVLEKTYSLNLAVAMVERTESYHADYEKINEEMRFIKARMPEVKPVGAMPFMAVDSITGYPLTDVDKSEGKYVCRESYLKRSKFAEVSGGLSAEKILDNMVTEKGDNSSLAVVHIDGNNMGKRIQHIMKGKEDYISAIKAMRAISKNIKQGFEQAYQAMETYIDQELTPQIKAKAAGKLHRKIILAGDDITFICNASAAMDAVIYFLREVAGKTLYVDSALSEIENRKAYSFSACAGIAFFNSHFPFSDAYQVAEACCGSAKSKAKEAKNREGGKADGNIGNFLDFQICTHIKAADLDSYREKNYVVEGLEKSIISRPYYVQCDVLDSYSGLNEQNKVYDVEQMLASIQAFKKIPRGQAKTLRNSYAMGTAEVERYLTFLHSRKAALPECYKDFWYDALELLDLYPKKEA